MTKDTFFNWSRFLLLFKKNIRENWKILGLRLLLMYGVLTIGMIWNGYFKYNKDGIYENDPTKYFMTFFFLWMICIFGAISASFIMEELKTKTNKISFLMNPSTQFEKFFMKWFIYVVLFFIAYNILFKFADCTKVLFYNLVYPNAKGINIFSLSYIFDIHNPGDLYCSIIQNCTELAMAISGFLFGQSLFILGGTVWPKNAFIKTFAAIIVFSFFAGFISYQGYKLFNIENNSLNVPDDILCNTFIVTTSILAIFNWTLSYFRFKETEIINRM